MIAGTGLEELCEVGNSAGQLQFKLEELFRNEFDQTENEKRIRILHENYDNLVNAERLIKLVYKG